MNIAIYVCLGAMLLFGFFSVLSRHLINAAISLAAVSAACGVLMPVAMTTAFAVPLATLVPANTRFGTSERPRPSRSTASWQNLR